MLNRIIRKKQLTDFTGLKRTALEDAVKRGDFPKPVKIGPRAIGWLEDDIAQWQRGMIAKRDDDSKSN
jgi:prophage regulatory protein